MLSDLIWASAALPYRGASIVSQRIAVAVVHLAGLGSINPGGVGTVKRWWMPSVEFRCQLPDVVPFS